MNYICPLCGASGATRWQLSAVPASTFLNRAEIEDHLLHQLTWRQHLWTLARWWTPWVEDTRSMIAVICIVWLTIVAIGVPWTGLQFAIAMAGFAWWLTKACLLRACCWLLTLAIAAYALPCSRGSGWRWPVSRYGAGLGTRSRALFHLYFKYFS